jgi:poly-gamma-glutamate synthesis protein (capsule biosynthesis protein)
MNIILSGDFYVSDEFKDKKLFNQSVVDFFHQSDYRLVNIEAPITGDISKNKIIKTGPHLRMSEDTVMSHLKDLKINTATLANNHILDFGANGLADTFRALENNQINYLGAGNTPLQASRPLSLEQGGVKIAFMNFCENEWSVVEGNKPGANPINNLENVKQIIEAKANNDKVICIFHGGHENYQLPSKRMVNDSHEYINAGADLVVWHHTHCYSGSEIYKGKHIFYGLGNFLFTRSNKNHNSNIGLVINIHFNKNKTIINKQFVIQNLHNSTVSFLEGERFDEHQNKFEELSQIISSKGLFEEYWEKRIESSKNSYMFMLSPFYSIQNKYLKYLILKLKLPQRYFSKRRKMIFSALIKCESHKELLEGIFNSEIKKFRR